MTQGKDTDHRKEILGIILKYIPKDKCVVFLFGSFAKNQVYSSSDIDIGIICDDIVGSSTLSRIKEELEKVRTLRDIDVIDFTGVTDKNFLKVALRGVEIWHQTKISRVFLASLKKRIKG